ncbi:hypothetical protein [Saccharolobus islandicus]|uniref:Uncharacterized protein n=1 Tax=Saccharolobus islandicus (strain M.16.4 / Kamchatka \|nr:hypothetical protein [Sulfolobus islandicus]ACR40781.1 hypothetical protein M164_0147 [Sulfolobus islandicus M.16.4]
MNIGKLVVKKEYFYITVPEEAKEFPYYVVSRGRKNSIILKFFDDVYLRKLKTWTFYEVREQFVRIPTRLIKEMGIQAGARYMINIKRRDEHMLKIELIFGPVRE